MLIDATVNEYVSWIHKALAKGLKPKWFYDYPMSRWARAVHDFTMNDECGARAIEILVDEGVSFSGEPGHNRLYLADGSMRGVWGGFPVYSNPEFLTIPGMKEFRDAELRRQALEKAVREAEYASEDMKISDVRLWNRR
jgi:hypothetical protein